MSELFGNTSTPQYENPNKFLFEELRQAPSLGANFSRGMSEGKDSNAFGLGKSIQEDIPIEQSEKLMEWQNLWRRRQSQ